jgi:NADH:ubiquinone reductase (H+-translocating)
MNSNQSKQLKNRPKVVIIGSGFAGLAATKRLVTADVDIILIDKSNHHVFQPLLYQVATAALSPAQIAQPTRTIVKNQKNCTVELNEVVDINTEKKLVICKTCSVDYDYLVIATGATHTYFSHDEWSEYAPGIKSIEDALIVRRNILNAFEQAETSEDTRAQKKLMTFVLIGGGPTGVEMAGAIAELARHTLVGEFRHINTKDARVVLIEGNKRILPTFPEALSIQSQLDLEELGVEVMTGQMVTECNENGVKINNDLIECHTIVWCAGVKASPAAKWLNVEHDASGRVKVNPDLSVPDHPDIFVVGDTAHVIDDAGITVPGLCPAAVQQGDYVAQIISNQINKQPKPAPFRYQDKGIMATIGRGKAVAHIKLINLSGFIAWCMWGAIHLIPLVGFRNRIVVAMDWLWSYLTSDRGVRLITSVSDNHPD